MGIGSALKARHSSFMMRGGLFVLHPDKAALLEIFQHEDDDP